MGIVVKWYTNKIVSLLPINFYDVNRCFSLNIQREKIMCLCLIIAVAATRRGVRVSFRDVFSIVKLYKVGVAKVAVGTTATVCTTKKRGLTLWGRPTLNIIIIGFPRVCI